MALAETNKMRPMTPVQLRAHLQRTLKRALEMDLPSQVKHLDGTTYQVPSTSRGNVIHLVETHGFPLLCTCEAFGHMPLCVHRAAVLLKRWAAEGRTVAVNEVGDVVVRAAEVDAATLAYPAERYPALVLPFDAPPEAQQAQRTPLSYRTAPTVSEYHADLLYDLDDDLLLDLDGDV